MWIDATPSNAARVMQALTAFGAPLADVAAADFARPGVVFQMGLPPVRIDVLTELTGLTCADAWPARVRAPFGPLSSASDLVQVPQQIGGILVDAIRARAFEFLGAVPP